LVIVFSSSLLLCDCWLCKMVVRSEDWVDELVADSNGLPEGASPKK